MIPNDEKKIELLGDFAGVVLRKSETGGLTVDLSALKDADVVTVVCGGGGWFKFRAPLQDDATIADTGSVSPNTLSPGELLLRFGTNEQKEYYSSLADRYGIPAFVLTSLPSQTMDNAETATVTKKAYRIGDVLPDGWAVGPCSPKTGIVMALEPVSGALDGYKTWHKGEAHAAELRSKGHATARQPCAASVTSRRLCWRNLWIASLTLFARNDEKKGPPAALRMTSR